MQSLNKVSSPRRELYDTLPIRFLAMLSNTRPLLADKQRSLWDCEHSRVVPELELRVEG